MSQVEWLDLEDRLERQLAREKWPIRPQQMSGRQVYTLREVLRRKKRR